MKNPINYLRRRAKLYGKPLAAGIGGGALFGGLLGASSSQDPESRFHKRPGRAALLGALAGGVGGGVVGGTAGAFQRQAQKARAFAHRQTKWGKPSDFNFEFNIGGRTVGGRRTKFQGGAAGYQRRERWQPYTGYGFGKGPTRAGAKVEGAHKIWDSVDERVRKKMQGVASRAQRGSTEGERAAARNVLEKMMKNHGIRGSIDDFIKHAAFRTGVLIAFTK